MRLLLGGPPPTPLSPPLSSLSSLLSPLSSLLSPLSSLLSPLSSLLSPLSSLLSLLSLPSLPALSPHIFLSLSLSLSPCRPRSLPVRTRAPACVSTRVCLAFVAIVSTRPPSSGHLGGPSRGSHSFPLTVEYNSKAQKVQEIPQDPGALGVPRLATRMGLGSARFRHCCFGAQKGGF